MRSPAVDLDAGIGRKDIARIRERFQALGEQRLARIRSSLTREQGDFLELLPLLLHMNHPMLPGFVSSEVPAGIYGLDPSRQAWLLARKYARSLGKPGAIRGGPPIEGLYLMGSMGSIGQSTDSDMDFWLCHAPGMPGEAAALLQAKATRIEEYALGIGLTVHFYLVDADRYRAGHAQGLSNESSGSVQHKLLLEEFYRTAILIAGKPPLWWLVPPDAESGYTDFTGRLLKRRFIKHRDWLDFGGLDELSAHEFVGAAYWLVFKGIEHPYKALLKLLLFEAYAAEFPTVGWLCSEAKLAVYSGSNIDVARLDPYRLLVERIEQHLLERNQLERLQLAQRALYVKSGLTLSRAPASTGWRQEAMIALTHGWGWEKADWTNMDSRGGWKLPRVLQERNALVAELINSFRLLTDFAARQGLDAPADTREFALLGRKLYAAMERRPGKIDNANPGISENLEEHEIWLRHERAQDLWRLYLGEPGNGTVALRSCQSLLEMLAWLQVNRVLGPGTLIHLDPPDPSGPEGEAMAIVRLLRQTDGASLLARTELMDFAKPAAGELAIMVINLRTDPFKSLSDVGLQLTSERVNPLSFGAAHACLVQEVDHLYSNSWGEAFVERHRTGASSFLDALCRYLTVFGAEAASRRPPRIHCFSSPRGHLIARYLEELASRVIRWFTKQGEDARYVVLAGDAFFEMDLRNGRYRWLEIGDEQQLAWRLQEPQESFSPCRIDPDALPDSPLAVILEDNLQGVSQLYYRVSPAGIALYLVDEHGAVFQQWLPGAEEDHFLRQQKRFFDTMHARLLTSATGLEQGLEQVRFGRVSQAQSGWLVERVDTPAGEVSTYLELTAITAGPNPWRDGFSLITGSREFSSLNLGDGLADAVAAHLVSLRRSRERYPVYLTGVICTAPGDTGQLNMTDALRFKYQLERRLAEAIKRLD